MEIREIRETHDRSVEVMRIVEDEQTRAPCRRESHGLARGNRTADLELCVVEDLDRSRSRNTPGDVNHCDRAAASVTGLDEPVVLDIAVDLQRMACGGFQDTSRIVCDQKAAHEPGGGAGIDTRVDDQRMR